MAVRDMDSNYTGFDRKQTPMVKKKTEGTAKQDAKLRQIMLDVRDDELAAEIYAEKTQTSIEDAQTSVKRIRRKITRSCEVNIKRELGEHLAALDALYATAAQTMDIKTALAVEKERGKTLSLYNQIEQRERDKTDPEKEEARRILAGLFDNPPERLDDLARATVNLIIESNTH